MSESDITIDAMTADDYDKVVRLWMAIPELGLCPSFDTRESITAYLERNAGLSSVARLGDSIVGAVLCGHDGRRGSIYHMAVAIDYRGQGLAKKLVDRCLNGLKAQGIDTAFLFVHNKNQAGAIFWNKIGWEIAPEIRYYSRSF